MVKICLHAHTNHHYKGNHSKYRTSNSLKNIIDYCFKNNVRVVAITDENKNSLPFIKNALKNLDKTRYKISDDELFVIIEDSFQSKKIYFVKGTEIYCLENLVRVVKEIVGS